MFSHQFFQITPGAPGECVASAAGLADASMPVARAVTTRQRPLLRAIEGGAAKPPPSYTDSELFEDALF